jgi:hypothetical protein
MPVKVARSTPRPTFGLPELLVAIHTSRLASRDAAKSLLSTLVSESSGESRSNRSARARRQRRSRRAPPATAAVRASRRRDGDGGVRCVAAVGRLRLYSVTTLLLSHLNLRRRNPKEGVKGLD